MAFWIRCRVGSATLWGELMQREMEAVETPANVATSSRLGRLLSRMIISHLLLVMNVSACIVKCKRLHNESKSQIAFKDVGNGSGLSQKIYENRLDGQR